MYNNNCKRRKMIRKTYKTSNRNRANKRMKDVKNKLGNERLLKTRWTCMESRSVGRKQWNSVLQPSITVRGTLSEDD